MDKKDDKKITLVASTSVDPNVRAILDMIQRQNEEHKATVNNLYKLIRDESTQRSKEIELIGKTMGELKLGAQSSVDTSEFNLIITDDTSVASRCTSQNTRIAKPPVKHVRTKETPGASGPANSEDEEEPASYERPMFDAITSIEFIPVLNGQDDIGVEGFIKRVREARSECKEKPALLRLILTKRIVGEAERSIRHSVIETYGDLFENLRKFVSINITSNGARDKLQRTLQSSNESVHGYVKRFRHNLNELIYALQHEIRDPIRRAVAIDLENERATKIFILNLRPEIEIRTSSTKPRNLQEAQDAAFEAELLIGEIERNRGNQRSQQMRAQPFTRGNVSSERNPPLRSSPMTMPSRPQINAQTNNDKAISGSRFNQLEGKLLQEKARMKCFKCNQIGHTANYCRNFQPVGQRNLPPSRSYNINMENTGQEEETTLPEPRKTSYEYTQQQEDSYPLEFDQEQEPNDI